MYSLPSPTILLESAVRWQQVYSWAKKEGRCQEFQKDEEIPSKIGWLYGVHHGTVRITGRSIQSPAQLSNNSIDSNSSSFLGFAVKNQPFEITRERNTVLQAVAHVSNTTVFWLRWDDLDLFPGFDHDILHAFRHQNQRKTMLMNNLSQNHATDRLLGYISLLIEEFGQPEGECHLLPFAITHHQLANAIGATRVTVTRLLGEMKERGDIIFSHNNRIALPNPHNAFPHLRLVE
jgi:hypothetical protein